MKELPTNRFPLRLVTHVSLLFGLDSSSGRCVLRSSSGPNWSLLPAAPMFQLEHEPDGRWFWSSFFFKYLAAIPWITNGMDAWNWPLSRKIACNHCNQWRNYFIKKRSLSKSTEKVQNLPNDTLDHIAKISSMSRKCRPKWIFGRDAWIKRLSRWFSGKRTRLPMQEKRVWSPGQENPLEKGVVTHSSILAWRIPWTEVPSWLQSMGLQNSQTQLSD